MAGKYKYLALEGGGSKGYIYLGVADALDKLEILKEVQAISGASVGAIGALLLATGWPVPKMRTLFNESNFSEMARGGWWEKFTAPFTFFKWFGLHRADRFHQLFKKIIKEVTGNENTTFRQWHALKEQHPELNLKDIFVEACNLNTKLNETFSHLSQHADVSIADAVRASMSFPVFFSPWKIKGNLYGDGGEQNNCPSDVFEETPGQPNHEVLSVRLDSLEEIRYFKYGILPSAVPINNGLECTFAHVESCLNAQNRMFYQSFYCQQTIFCDTLDVPTLDFELKNDTKVALEASGFYGVTRYMHKHHPDITDKRCDKETLEKIKETDFPISFTEFLSKQSEETAPEGSEKPSRIEKPITPLYHHWKGLCAMQDKCNEFMDIDYSKMPKVSARTFRKPSHCS